MQQLLVNRPKISFFDSENISDFCFFEKDETEYKKIDQSKIIHQGILLKHQQNQAKPINFVLTDTNLFSFENDSFGARENISSATMQTINVRLDFNINKRIDDPNFIFCFRFLKNGQFFDLYSPDEISFQKWQIIFSKVFIQVNFHEKFSTINLIGKGSFAKVYKIKNNQTGEFSAVKVFQKPAIFEQPFGKKAILNEITLMRQMSHSCITKLLEVHESENSLYLVMDLASGDELFRYVTSNNHLDAKDIKHVIKSILEALKYLEENKIIHRDLKFENIICKEPGKLKDIRLQIVDFGLATPCEIEEYIYKKCGTPGFVAPEILKANAEENTRLTPKCDVFSAGVIFYTLITGVSPFQSNNVNEIIHKNQNPDIDFKHTNLRKNRVLRHLIKKLLEADPEKRLFASQALKHPFFQTSVLLDKNENEVEVKKESYVSIIDQKNIVDAIPQIGDHSNNLYVKKWDNFAKEGLLKVDFDSSIGINSNVSLNKKQHFTHGKEGLLKFLFLQTFDEHKFDCYHGDCYMQTFWGVVKQKSEVIEE